MSLPHSGESMTLYFIIAALVLAGAAGVTFKTKCVTHQQFFICVILFPIAYLISGLPTEGLIYHLSAAIVAYIVGWAIRLVERELGGGVIYAFTIAALWIPGLSLFWDYLVAALIAGMVLTVIVMAVRRSTSELVRDYAAMTLLTCSGFFLFQLHQGDFDPNPSQAIQANAQQSLDTAKLELR